MAACEEDTTLGGKASLVEVVVVYVTVVTDKPDGKEFSFGVGSDTLKNASEVAGVEATTEPFYGHAIVLGDCVEHVIDGHFDPRLV